MFRLDVQHSPVNKRKKKFNRRALPSCIRYEILGFHRGPTADFPFTIGEANWTHVMFWFPDNETAMDYWHRFEVRHRKANIVVHRNGGRFWKDLSLWGE
jgi:hypothetical protein